ncbi:MAG: histidine phosphatase family protein [Rhabdochlamydiaceae bacterium]
MSVEFDLMRHGESVWNTEGKLQGQLPNSENGLTEKGRAQVTASARMLVNRLQDRKVMVWSSPSPRAHETAEIIIKIFNDNKLIHLDQRVMEASHGSFEGQTETEYQSHPHYNLSFGFDSLAAMESFVEFPSFLPHA